MNESRAAGLIQVQGVRKSFQKGDVEVTALDGLDLEVAPGEFLALMGPSGSGKSTLLNLMAGIDRATAGRIIVGGEDITDWGEDELADWRTRNIGYVFQQFNLMPVLTAYENVELPLLLLPLTRAKRRKQVMTALELVELKDRASHFPRQLSGGQEQRVAIARAIVTDPKILFLDEPTGSLDRASADGVMDLLEKLNRRFEKTIVLVTHDITVAERAKRVVHLDKGTLAQEASAAQEVAP